MYEHGETVEHIPWVESQEDDYGNVSGGHGAPVPIPGVAVGPTDTTEDNRSGSRLTTGLTLLFQHRVPEAVDHRDQFVVRGRVYEVVGELLEYRNPFTGEAPGATVNVRRSTG